MESFSIKTAKCWFDILKIQLQQELEKKEALDQTVKALLVITSKFFSIRWPIWIDLLKKDEVANNSKTKT